MFRFLVVCVAISMASAAPGLGYGGSYGGGYGGYGHYGVVPAATSYSSRVDVHTPVLKTYSSPAILASPVITKAYVSPALSYHSAPLVSSYGIGHGYDLGHGYGLGHGYDLGHGYGLNGYGHGYNLGYGHGW